jgi:hypothetical protein
LDARIGSKAGVGSDAGNGLDTRIWGNNSSGNPTKLVYPMMMDNITVLLITIFCLFFYPVV